MYTPPDPVRAPLYVVTPIFNPTRVKARWKHYQRFKKMVLDAGAHLIAVECAYGKREHALEPSTEENYTTVLLRTPHELWLKESLINIGIARLSELVPCWDYVAWIDADVSFARPNWVGETIHQLQAYRIVQMFSQAYDLGPNYEVIGSHESFMANYLRGDTLPGTGYGSGGSGGGYGSAHKFHPGFAWAARRQAIDDLGGLIDYAILGAGDQHMARALIGKVNTSLPAGLHPRYRERLKEWETRAERHVRRNVGFVSGALLHMWHGKKRDRGYADRWKILIRHQFRPDLDLKRDSQGLLQLADRGDLRSVRLRTDIQNYFRSRNEDSIDV